MQVNIFISTSGDDDTPILLVLPSQSRTEIPTHLRKLRWRQLAITSLRDQLLGSDASEIEVGLAEAGYALVRDRFRESAVAI